MIEELDKSAPANRSQFVIKKSQSTMTATGFNISSSPARIEVAIGRLPVTLEKVGQEYVASELRTGMYGEGDSPEEALASLDKSLRDLRDVLHGRVGGLAPDLAADLEYLDRVL
jgi:hypothetical protein